MDKMEYLGLISPAIDLVLKKHEDYGTSDVGLDAYFPFGDVSYVQMMHMKTLRLISLVQSNREPNFESINDTVLDLINYAVFYLSYLKMMSNDKI